MEIPLEWLQCDAGDNKVVGYGTSALVEELKTILVEDTAATVDSTCKPYRGVGEHPLASRRCSSRVEASFRKVLA